MASPKKYLLDVREIHIVLRFGHFESQSVEPVSVLLSQSVEPECIARMRSKTLYCGARFWSKIVEPESVMGSQSLEPESVPGSKSVELWSQSLYMGTRFLLLS